MTLADKKKAGEMLMRGGISQRIIEIATDISNGSYKNAIERAGQIAVLVDAAKFDSYWNGKAIAGKQNETEVLTSLIKKELPRGKVISTVNPYST